MKLAFAEHNNQAGSSSKPTPKHKNRHDIFASASRALSGRVPASGTASHKAPLHASDTGMKIFKMDDYCFLRTD